MNFLNLYSSTDFLIIKMRSLCLKTNYQVGIKLIAIILRHIDHNSSDDWSFIVFFNDRINKQLSITTEFTMISSQ